MDIEIRNKLEKRITQLKSQIEKSQNGEAFYKFVRGPFCQYLDAMDMLTKEMRLDEKGNLIPIYSTRLADLLMDFFTKAEYLRASLDDGILAKELCLIFRDFGSVYYRSEIIAHASKKPRGYPGDFEMMNHVYNDVTISRDVIGKYFDRYHLDMGYAQAVRGRKNKMVQLLKSTMNECKRPSLRVLNIPCGPARDVQEFVTCRDLRKDLKLEIVCVDYDLEALKFAKDAIRNIPQNIKIDFQQGNIISYVRHPEQHLSKFGKFDLVYSIGLADYLPDKILQKMIEFSWKLLRKDGVLIYAFKIEDRDPFAPVPPKWGCDWEFVSRSMAAVSNVISKSLLGAYTLDEPEWEETERIVFIKIRKAK
jgi:hypothetical protein